MLGVIHVHWTHASVSRGAHYCNSNIIARTRPKIQHCIEKELDKNHFICSNDGNMDVFKKLFAHRIVICRMGREHNYVVNNMFV